MDDAEADRLIQALYREAEADDFCADLPPLDVEGLVARTLSRLGITPETPRPD